MDETCRVAQSPHPGMKRSGVFSVASHSPRSVPAQTVTSTRGRGSASWTLASFARPKPRDPGDVLGCPNPARSNALELSASRRSPGAPALSDSASPTIPPAACTCRLDITLAPARHLLSRVPFELGAEGSARISRAIPSQGPPCLVRSTPAATADHAGPACRHVMAVRETPTAARSTVSLSASAAPLAWAPRPPLATPRGAERRERGPANPESPADAGAAWLVGRTLVWLVYGGYRPEPRPRPATTGAAGN
jgi:hypothetical protein